jgi:glycosyltransferase involved in cell wall biosynthesis
MRVGLIAPPWLPVPPPAYGGTEGVIDTLARGLTRAGHEVELASVGESTCPVPKTFVYEHARSEQLGDMVVELRHLLDAYRAFRHVDIVHDHTVAGPVLAATAGDRRVVTTNHGPFTPDALALYQAIGDRVPIVAISRHQASTAPGVRIARVIHHGLDVGAYPLGDGRGGYLAFLGRMSATKGVENAIKVARRAGMPLLIAAKMREPGEREYYDAVVAPLVDRDVRYVGELGMSEKLELLGGASALLNPIDWDEPYGLCMIEALACGTPVLATPRGAVPEIVDDGSTGFIRPDLGSLAAAVADVPGLDRRACRAAVRERFSAERLVADHLAFYEDVIAGRSGRVVGDSEPLPLPVA